MCMSHSSVINVFQSGGGATLSAKAAKRKKTMVASGTEVHQPREVASMSKTHIFSLNLLPLSGEV